MGIPLVLACNMMDEAKSAGINIDMPRLGNLFGVPVAAHDCQKDEGVWKSAFRSNNCWQGRTSFTVENILWARSRYGVAWTWENNWKVRAPLKISIHQDLWPSNYWKMIRICSMKYAASIRKFPQIFKAICNKASKHIRETFNASPESVITDHRYGYIHSVLQDGVITFDPSRIVLFFGQAGQGFDELLFRSVDHAFRPLSDVPNYVWSGSISSGMGRSRIWLTWRLFSGCNARQPGQITSIVDGVIAELEVF